MVCADNSNILGDCRHDYRSLASPPSVKIGSIGRAKIQINQSANPANSNLYHPISLTITIVFIHVIQNIFMYMKKLYKSKIVTYKENKDKTITLVLTENGKEKILIYDLDSIKLQQQDKWDGLWRIVIFDVPERFKKGRNALSSKLKQLGLHPLQKSVFIYPYECKDEIDFIVEFFKLKPYVRFILAKETDIDLDLKYKFKLKTI